MLVDRIARHLYTDDWSRGGGVVAGALEPLLTDRVSGRLTYSTGMLIFSPERAKMIFPDWSGFPSTTSTFSPVRITMYCAWAAEATRLEACNKTCGRYQHLEIIHTNGGVA